jgi:hypothetical protein
MSTIDSKESKVPGRNEQDIARATGQLEGTENRENADPGSGPLMRERSAKSVGFEDEDDEED